MKYRVFDGTDFYYATLYDIATGWPASDAKCLHSELEFQMFTGLKDNNGVDIYEGDEVEVRLPLGDFVGRVIFESGALIIRNENTYILLIAFFKDKNPPKIYVRKNHDSDFGLQQTGGSGESPSKSSEIC